jgi:hypothetical protein
MAKTKGKSKKELLNDQIARQVGAGREVAIETVDFSDSNRPKTCLEVDFPILPINQIAGPEMCSGAAKKPIYAWQKWWARRSSAVFRGMLIASAQKAPDDETKTAKAVWEVYYANHQRRRSLCHLRVADPFMGGGTTIVEGSRLGMQMFGCDLNPVAWFVTKNEMAKVDVEELTRLLAQIEAEVKPQIMPYYACNGPGEEKGKWFRCTGTRMRETRPVQLGLHDNVAPGAKTSEDVWEELPSSFDIFSVPWQERKQYRYNGPEIIYTFWTKHGPCQREGCGHRTPIKITPTVAVKRLSVDAWLNVECSGCRQKFDVERIDARMAPDAAFVVSSDEKPFAVMDGEGCFVCPHCGKSRQDKKAHERGESSELGKAESKKVELTLLVHPQWLEGSPRQDNNGLEYGGSVNDSVEATIRWHNARAAKLRFVEVRGSLPNEITCTETGVTFSTGADGGTVTKPGHFECQAATCGMEQPNSQSFAKHGSTAPISPLVIQGYSSFRDANGFPYNGRFFQAAIDTRAFNAACSEWDVRKDGDLRDFWPHSEIPFGHMTHQRQPLPDHGYTHWWKMFNPIQLILHALICKTLTCNEGKYSQSAVDAALGIWHRYLQHENMLCFWDETQDCVAPSLANSNFHPKNTIVQNNPFSKLGRGNWASSVATCIEALEWKRAPWDLVAASQCEGVESKAKTIKIPCGDSLTNVDATLRIASATELNFIETDSIDLVITDPPFGGLLHYSELSDFFYVWLRLALRHTYIDAFTPEFTPKTLEAVANIARHPEDADAFYQRVLTDCWHEAYRVLKPGGILAFTFHHSEDEPWVSVLESLFESGFYLEATYPIRSDETKGEGEFGSKQIEYDIIHVCRKRISNPQPISWARLRRMVVDDVRRIKNLLTQHQSAGLPAADLQVIKRGKALEYFSRHYGTVYIERDREFTIREALVGINQLLDDDTSGSGGPEAPPSNAEPFTRQFLRIFYETTVVPRDQMQKFLRGTGIAPSDFEERGWCFEKNKMFILTPPLELARGWKGASRKGMARDFDQTMFLVGGCFEGSNIRVMDTLDSPNFAPHPATVELVDWLIRHGGSKEIKFAAQRAQTIYRDWLGKNKAKAQEQIRLFDLED